MNENVPYFGSFKFCFILSGIPENICSDILLNISKKHLLSIGECSLIFFFFFFNKVTFSQSSMLIF